MCVSVCERERERERERVKARENLSAVVSSSPSSSHFANNVVADTNQNQK